MALNIIVIACLLTGLALSLILVQHYIQEEGGFAEKWCSRTGGKHGCSPILDSRFAKTFGVSHADFGIIYFGGALLLSLSLPHISWLVALLSLVALIYSVFSIFVQKYVLRQFCSLCILVQIAVIVQAGIIFSSAKVLTFLPKSLTECVTAIIIFLIPAVAWFFMRGWLVERNAKRSGQHPLLSARSLAKFRKHKGKLPFEALEGDLVCTTAKPAENQPSKSKDTPWRVVIGIAPSCAHCGDFLSKMLALIEQEQLPIELTIRFVVLGMGDDHDGINDQTVTETVMALAQEEGHAFAIKQLHNWYHEFNGKDLAGWLATFRPIEDHERNTAGAFMADNTFWLDEQDVEDTPAVFIEQLRIEPQDSVYAPEVLRKLCQA